MSYTIKQDFLTPNKYSRPQTKLKGVKGVIIHYVGNTNTSAQNNRNYWENLKNQKDGSRFASAHYLVGLKGEVIQALPESEMAYHVGAKKYKSGIQQKLGSYPNHYTIGIEATHIKDNGEMSQATYDTLVELTANLLKYYKLDTNDLYLHYDVTGKLCHKWFVENPTEWKKFKTLVANEMSGVSKPVSKVESAVSQEPNIVESSNLQKGDKGDAVKELQTLLNANGANLEIDGVFGKATHDAVMRAEESFGFSPDGIVGEKVIERLKEAVSAPKALKKGDKGEDIKELQRLLNNHGANLVVDGDFGSATHNAVLAFEKKAGFEADGIVGSKTLEKLKESPKLYGQATGDVWLHSKPDVEASTRTEVLREGSMVEILGTTDTMYHTNKGYVSMKYILKRL